MASSLQDKAVIVTGSGSGIGQAIAIAMADEGAKVVVNDLGSSTRGEGSDIALADRTIAMIRERGGEAVANYDDVGSMEGAQGIIDTALSSYGRIDSLVNNAGIIRHNMLWDMSEDDFDLVVQTHLKGHFATIKAAAPHMMEQRSGSIINIASTMGIDGGATVLGYSAAKAGILGLTLTAGLELGPYGIRVNAVCPSGATRITDAGVAWRTTSGYQLSSPHGSNPARGSIADPADVAPMVIYLSRDVSENVNGQVFVAGNGRFGVYQPWKTSKMLYNSGGRWDQEELDRIFPSQLLTGLSNPSPRQDQDPIIYPWLRGG